MCVVCNIRIKVHITQKLWQKQEAGRFDANSDRVFLTQGKLAMDAVLSSISVFGQKVLQGLLTSPLHPW